MAQLCPQARVREAWRESSPVQLKPPESGVEPGSVKLHRNLEPPERSGLYPEGQAGRGSVRCGSCLAPGHLAESPPRKTAAAVQVSTGSGTASRRWGTGLRVGLERFQGTE